MKENKYDDPKFFERYGKMLRSEQGLDGAGEWHAFRAMFPPLEGKRVVDLGCGYGWHCRYVMENGAASAVGVDLSEKMLTEAKKRNALLNVRYVRLF